jgi:hypothetical protein
MSMDITSILKDWPYEPGRLTARRIRDVDGRDKIQLRLDLGLLQMEVSGRPDGARPHDCESLLDYYEKQRDLYRKQHGNDEGFMLDSQTCDLLRAEGLLYYHRYIAEFVLEDFQAAERDTSRNLRLMDFCTAHATDAADRHALEQYCPYVMMMRTRARCQAHLADHRTKDALAALKRGIREITHYYTSIGQEQAIENSAELSVLKALTEQVQSQMPVDPLVKLKEALAKAVAEERYEEAAALRDRIRWVSEHRSQYPGPQIV